MSKRLEYKDFEHVDEVDDYLKDESFAGKVLINMETLDSGGLRLWYWRTPKFMMDSET